MRIIKIADIVDPDSGKTYRQINLEKGHSIPIGALVELDDGVRLFVVKHGRDCDGTPLYWLSWTVEPDHPDGNYMHKYGGFLEDSLKIIKLY
jgi:hypothetical protein